MRARYPRDGIRRNHVELLIAASLACLTALGAHHVWALRAGGASNVELIVAGAFTWLCLTVALPYFHSDAIIPAAHQFAGRAVRSKRITVIVPVHNEDPAMFRAMLDSVSAQTRLPRRLHVVENGYPEHKLRPVFEEWKRDSCPPGVQAIYGHHLPAGKREAQAVAFLADPAADIFATVDSDIRLDKRAIELGVAPFGDERVMSVGGLLVGENAYKSWLTRLVELSFVCSFLNGRTAWSVLGSVSVNSGGLAFYRGFVVRKYLKHYLGHKVFGRTMSYGDDAMLTRYSLLEGRTFFQTGSWGYTLHPENLRHLTKQRIRWWRSFFWGNLWLLRTFRPDRVIWWLIAAEAVRFVWFAALIPYVFFIQPAITGKFAWAFFAWVTALSYLSGLRYLALRRPGESFLTHLVTWLLAPASGLLSLYLGVALQYAGLFTCLKTGWSTRGQVEVGLGGPASSPGGTTSERAAMADATQVLPVIIGSTDL